MIQGWYAVARGGFPIDRGRLREIRKRKGLSQKELAEIVGVSAKHISEIESGKSSPSWSLLERIAKALGVDPTYLVRRDETPLSDDRVYEWKDLVTFPVVDRIHAGVPTVIYEEAQDWMALPKGILGSGNFVGLRVVGDSMVGAGIEDGDIVVVKLQDYAVSGDIVIAQTRDGEMLIRLYKERGGKALLKAANPEYDDIIFEPGEIKIVGIVKKVIKEPKRRWWR